MTEIKNNTPEKVYQDAQKTTDKLTTLSAQAARLEVENKVLQEKLDKEDKKITVTLKEVGDNTLSGLMHGMFYGVSPKAPKVESIEINNVDEADKFLTTVLESDISKERDAIKEKYEKLEKKMDEKDAEITSLERNAKRLRSDNQDRIQDLYDQHEKTVEVITKTADDKVKAKLIKKAVENRELQNKLDLKTSEMALAETELKGHLETFKQANDALETRINAIEKNKLTFKSGLGAFLQKMTGYKKALREVGNYNWSTRRYYGVSCGSSYC